MSSTDEFSRQSFLGPKSQEIIQRCVVGIVGLGGGGSHIVQQLAHIGFLNFVIFDDDEISESNLNRLVGGTAADVRAKRAKVKIARRVIKAIRPKANVAPFKSRWQEESAELKRCDIVFGSIDGLDQRRQLEAACRRFLIPLIDVGMTVHIGGSGIPSMTGQVILSMPGHSCMHCLGFLSDDALAEEAAKYGDAGINPQVVWPNGILASTAVGLAVNLLTDWSRSLRGPVYLSYRGGAGTLTPDPLAAHADPICTHYPLAQAGQVRFTSL